MRYITDPETGKIGPSVADCADWAECRRLEIEARRKPEMTGREKRPRRKRGAGQLDLFATEQQGQLPL